MRTCEVNGCTEDNANVSFHYGKSAICGDCLTKAVECYIRLKKDLSYIE